MANVKGIKARQYKPEKVEVLTPEKARYLAEAEGRNIMQEYTRLRKVAQERLRKLEKAGLSDTAVYSENVHRFPGKKEIGSDMRMLYDAIADVTQFLAAKKSTVGGYRAGAESAIEKFTRPDGSEGLTGMDWRTFGKMMGAIKSHARSSAYYRGWKNAYRSALSAAKKRGMSAEQLNAAVAAGTIQIGVRGGLKNGSGKRLR